MLLDFSKMFRVLCFLILVGCTLTKRQYFDKKDAPHVQIFKQYGFDFNSFQMELDSLKELVDHSNSEIEEVELRNQLTATRMAFKKIEFVFDYLEPGYSYLYVNGGPLPKLHKEVAEIDIIPPNGLQRLDELVFSEEMSECLPEIIIRTNELVEAIAFIKESHLNDSITQQNTFEFLRSGIVRVFTLGLTGFDTPGSGNGIEESLASLESMRNAFTFYNVELIGNRKYLFDNILSLYDDGISFIENNNDFDSFDRMGFLKNVINPLYKELYTFQKELGIDTSSLNMHAQNYNTENLFDEDFMDRNYYTRYTYSDVNNKAAIKLGKTLFYDPILSRNIDMSCTSCHNPKKGFADGLAKSQTNRPNVFTKRNSPTLIDAAYSSKYFWDMREHDLENQVAHVVEDSLEFNIGFAVIEKRLNQSVEYVKMFEAAFGGISGKAINRRSISNAIASYVNTLTSFDSPFDQYVRGKNEYYSDSARVGFNLFMGKAACGTCHFAPAFNGSVPPFYSDAESEVLGVTEGYDTKNPVLDKDMGRSQNLRKGDAHSHFDHSFKTVTVRNSALTAPYMHNGLFETLEDVINFYNDGGGAGMGIDIDNQTLASDSLHLTDLEKLQLIEFLHSLTDTSGLNPGKIELPNFQNQPYWNQRGKPRIID